MENYEDYYGVYCGRFNPLHAGHESVINEMLKLFGADRSRIIIGSANSPQSLRHFFSYEERRDLIKTVFPEIKIMPLGDFYNTENKDTTGEWILALDDLLISSGMDPEKVVFFGGCEEDIMFFISINRRHHLLNRFDGTTPRVSATEIRDALVHKRPLNNFINPSIEEKVRSLFEKKWLEFQSR